MTLILLPNLLHPEADPRHFLPEGLKEIVQKLDGLIAETPKEGRLFLKKMGRAPSSTPQKELNEHTTPQEMEELLEPLKRGQMWGVVSDSGVPCLADPGAKLVAKARDSGIAIEAIAGPSSIVLVLMLSGFNGQNFSFLGYLPKEKELLLKALKEMEQRALSFKQTQIFIETPYRNEKLFQTLVTTMSSGIKLCVACNLTAKDQYVTVHRIDRWKTLGTPPIQDKPTIFAISL